MGAKIEGLGIGMPPNMMNLRMTAVPSGEPVASELYDAQGVTTPGIAVRWGVASPTSETRGTPCGAPNALRSRTGV